MEKSKFQIVEPMIRAWANVAMICTTLILNKEKFKDRQSIPRENLVCKITYVAQGKHETLQNKFKQKFNFFSLTILLF